MVKIEQPGQLQVDVPVLELAHRPDRRATCRSTRWCSDLLGASGGTFKNPADELLPDRTRHAEDGRERRPGLHGHSHPVRPVPQPSVRSLDDGRLLQLRRVLLADRPQAGRRLSRDDHLQPRRRRGAAPGRRPRDDAEVPRRRRRPNVEPGKDRREVLAKWLTSPENPYFATNVANRIWAHFFGLGIVEPVDDVRVSNPAEQPRTVQGAGRQAGRIQVRLQAARPRHLQLAHLPAHRRERNESNATDDTQLRPRRVRRIPAENAARLHQPGDRARKDKFHGLPLGARAVQIADGQTQHLLPHHLRPLAARNGLRRATRRPIRRCRRRCTCSTATRLKARSAKAAS